MTDASTTPERQTPSTTAQRTIAIYSAPNSPALLLEETITALIASSDVQRGVIDLSTVAGLTAASAFRSAGVPYDALEFGQEDHLSDGHPTELDAAALRADAAGVQAIEASELAAIDANLVVIPAIAETDGVVVDFSAGTVPGAVVSQAEDGAVPILLVLPPERGLRPVGEGTYQRAVLHIDPTVDSV